MRPLAELLVREIAAALPAATCTPTGDLVSIACPGEIGVLLIGSRELRLGLSLADAPFEGMVGRSRIPGTGPRITHMVVLSDARQVGEPLIELIRQAARCDTSA